MCVDREMTLEEAANQYGSGHLAARELRALQDKETKDKAEIKRLQQWVDDLQTHYYVNCVYCGHNYGSEHNVPASMADILKEHIEHCPKHPLSKMRVELNQANCLVVELKAMIDTMMNHK